jgi:single-strand DNA-binding protein
LSSGFPAPKPRTLEFIVQGINKVILFGHLGADPELRRNAKGMAWCRLRLATTHSRRKDDEWVEDTTWHSITLFDAQAENAARVMGKGSAVLIEGHLALNRWEDAQGQKHYDVQILGDHYHCLTSTRREPIAPMESIEDDGRGPTQEQARSRAALPPPSADPIDTSEEIPF